MPPYEVNENASLERDPVDNKPSLSENESRSFVIDPSMERKLWKKLDRNLMPILSVLFLLSFL